jgi:hypothetical protein
VTRIILIAFAVFAIGCLASTVVYETAGSPPIANLLGISSVAGASIG